MAVRIRSLRRARRCDLLSWEMIRCAQWGKFEATLWVETIWRWWVVLTQLSVLGGASLILLHAYIPIVVTVLGFVICGAVAIAGCFFMFNRLSSEEKNLYRERLSKLRHFYHLLCVDECRVSVPGELDGRVDRRLVEVAKEVVTSMIKYRNSGQVPGSSEHIQMCRQMECMTDHLDTFRMFCDSVKSEQYYYRRVEAEHGVPCGALVPTGRMSHQYGPT